MYRLRLPSVQEIPIGPYALLSSSMDIWIAASDTLFCEVQLVVKMWKCTGIESRLGTQLLVSESEEARGHDRD